MRLLNTISLITGAGRGIGAAIAQAFVANGSFVYVTDINEEDGLRISKHLGVHSCAFRRLDVRCESDWESVTSSILQERGSLDIVVNNAAITGFEALTNEPHDPEHASLEAWRRVHETNLDGVFLGCKHAIKSMRSKGSGSIINISSRSGLIGIPMAAAYASSKAAVRNHTKSVALYCAQQKLNIRCNSIHPAAILTPMWEPMLGTGPDREAIMAEIVQDTPLRRFGRPDEVAAVAVLLASEEAGYMTGTEINIDGGILAGSAGVPK